ncbi:unnamed protein product [Discosporangium mesarthrocarpum]
MAEYTITVVEETGEEVAFKCDDDVFVLEAGEEAGVDFHYSCRGGACSTCAGKLLEGTIDQSEQTFLTDEQVEDNFILTCISYPKSDCKIQINVESELY